MFLLTSRVWSQCNVQSNKRPDGVTIKFARPELLSKNDKAELGITLQTDGKSYYLGTVVRFLGAYSKKSVGSLTIRYSNNSSSILKLTESSLSYNRGSNVGIALYKLLLNDIKLIKANSLKTIYFKTEDNLIHLFKVSSNNIMVKQINCLN